MCMVSGIIGEQPAAEELAEMSYRQEPAFGGFYSGIGTLSGGQIHVSKNVGGITALGEDLDLLSMPGDIGIAHSRTNDGGGCVRAQPYVDQAGLVASSSNGSNGIFEEEATQRLNHLAIELVAAGVEFNSIAEDRTLNDIVLPDGRHIHGGEIIIQSLARRLAAGMPFAEAYRDVGVKTEIVGLYLLRDDPEALYIANVNQSIVVAKRNSTTFVATSSLAFNQDALWVCEIPCNTIARVSKDGKVELEPLWEDEARIYTGKITGATDAFHRFVVAQPGSTWSEIRDGAILPLFPEDMAVPSAPAAHRAMEDLLDAGRIRSNIAEVTGVDGQFPVRQFRFYPVK